MHTEKMKTSAQTTKFADSDVDLIATVASQSDDKDVALNALRTLHARYSSWCLGIARSQDYSGIDAEMVVSKTFVSVWEAAETFDPAKRRKEVSLGNAVKAWIYRILKNEILSEVRDRASRNEIALWADLREDSDEATRDSRPAALGAVNCSQVGSFTEKPQPGQMAFLKELMQSLTPKEQLILDLSAAYVAPNPPFKCHIPKDELSHLANQIGVAPASIKVLRERAYEKLRKLAKSHIQLPANKIL